MGKASERRKYCGERISCIAWDIASVVLLSRHLPVPFAPKTLEVMAWLSARENLSGPTSSMDGISDGRRITALPPYGVEIVSKPFPVRTGSKALRMELRRGDCGKFRSGTDDCLHGNERVEMVTSDDDFMSVNSKGTYGWSFYLEPDWNPTDLCEIVMGQFHQVGQFNPAFQFFYQSHGAGLHVKSRVGTNNGTLGKDIRTIIPEKELRGKWHDIRVDSYWRRKSDGYFRVYVDGVLAYDFKGSTTTAKQVYFKIGIYRLAAELESPNLVVYYDDIFRR